jgi:cytochrome P450
MSFAPPTSAGAGRLRDARPLPITTGDLADFPADPIACMRALHERHGAIAALEQGRERIVFVFGPHYNKLVLSDPAVFHSRFFALRGPRHSAQRRLTSGLLSMNGQDHKRHRRLIMGPFQRRSFACYRDAIVRLTEQMLEGWQLGQTRNLHRDMTRFMLQVTSSILFGFDRTELAYRIGESLDRWVEMNHHLSIGALAPDAFDSDGYERLLKFADALETEIQHMIDLRRREAQSGGDSCADVLSILVRSHDEQGGLADQELIGHAALLFGAAHLTTANTLTWTLLLLAQHPEVMRQLHGELAERLGGRPPQLDELDSLETLDRVIKESMRVLPASSYSQRVNDRPVRLGPFDLPRGTPVVFSQFITHHLPELFPQPDRFLPDRWAAIDPSPYAYLPFATGPRMCLGGPLALMILKIVLPMIVQRFRLVVPAQADVGARVTATMLAPTTPVPVVLYPVDGRFEAHPIRGTIRHLVQLPQ